MQYDVTIVGAGPAGSTAAKFLSEKGFKVLLIDKSKFPRYKPCGGGLPVRVLDRFKYITEENLIESYSYGGIAYSPSLKYKLELIDDKPLIAMTLREKFDHGLVKLAKKSGAVVYEGKTVVDVKILKDKAKIALDDGSLIDSYIIIGADGVWSLVAKKTGLQEKKPRIAVCVLKEYKLDEATLDKYFEKNRSCHLHARFHNIVGYGWIFPKKEHLNIGIGEIINRRYNPDKKNLLDLFKSYINTLKKEKIVPDYLKTDGGKGGALPISPLDKTYGNRVIMVGDAAGFINPITGEGIYYAMSSGEIAAKVVCEALETGNTDETFLSRFQRNWWKDFGEDIDLLVRSLNVRGKDPNEKMFRIASKDEKLRELAVRILTGQLSAKKYKWKVARRILYGTIKDHFSKSE